MSEKSFRPRRFLATANTTTGRVQRLGIAVLGVIVAMAVFAPLITPFGPSEAACDPFATPSRANILGCDDAGHDLFAQLLYGARVSLFVGLSVALVATSIAVVIAIVAGYFGGWIDRLLMRVIDVVLSLPFLPLVIVLGVFLGASLTTQIVVIALVMWAQPVRELRAQILSIRSMGFVEAALSMGAGSVHVGTRHILPEVAPLIVPQFVRIAHNAILVETSLSFLGLGDPLQTSWGTILYHANARAAFLTGSWLWWIAPAGLAVSVTVTALAFIGFGYDASLSSLIRRKPRARECPEGVATEGAILSVRDLQVGFHTDHGFSRAVRGVSFDLMPGELVGLVGESGSGKTTTAMAVLGLLHRSAEVTRGAAYLQETNLLGISVAQFRDLRGRKIALIPQSAMNALNPVMTIGAQLAEALDRSDDKLDRTKRDELTADWLSRVGLDPRHAKSYAHELSGGMRQRAVIAIALCNTPDLVIADEPTTGLDVLVQEEIMALLLDLRRRLNLSILFVTHNLPLIARHADRIEVMYQGEIVDEGSADTLRAAPRHQHTRDLFENLPELHHDKRWTPGEASGTPLVALDHVSKVYHARNALGLSAGQAHQALTKVNLALYPGEKLGLVGGSGAGKSTIARLLMGLIGPDEGQVLFDGRPLQSAADRRAQSQTVHMVFQDPYNSMRNAMSVRDVVAEPLRIRGERDQAAITAKVRAALEAVALPSDDAFLMRMPIAMSGGQRQRVAFARAIVTEPRVIIADEPTSMLDQSIRMEIMELMDSLRRRFGTAFLFVTHDIVLARHFCDRVIVLRDGHVVEEGLADDVIHRPSHEYTKALIEAA